MMVIRTQNKESASEDSVNTHMTPDQKKIALLEQQIREMKKAINALNQRLQSTDKKASVAYNNAHTNKIGIYQLKEHLNQGH